MATEVTNFYAFEQAFNFSYWGYASAIATLMLGSAGVGHHLLRLHAPRQVPPVLLFTDGVHS